MAVANMTYRGEELQTGPTTLTGLKAGERARIPAENFFGEAEYLPGAWTGAANLVEIGATLVGYYPELRHLADTEIDYVWKKKGGNAKGKPILGELKKSSPLLSFYAEVDYQVVIHAANCYALTNRQLEAAVYHQLLHLIYDEELEKTRVTGHDLEMFRQEVVRYGLWTPDLEAAKSTFSQIELPGVEPVKIYGNVETIRKVADAEEAAELADE